MFGLMRRVPNRTVCGLVVLTAARALAGPPASPPASPLAPAAALECVDCPRPLIAIGDQGLRLDASGRCHVGFVGDDVSYAREDGRAWSVERLAAAPAAIYDGTWTAQPALALDAGGAPQLAFLGPDNRSVRHARRRGSSGWEIRTVATAAAERTINFEVALALDGAGAPHLVWAEHGTLTYARPAGAGWAIETVDASGFAEMYFSLQLDAADVPHVSYFYAAASKAHLKYASRAGGRWQTEFVDRSGFLGEFNSLALDGTGAAHVSYLDVTHDQLKHARRRGLGRWEIEVVDDAKWFGGFSSLALDGAGRPHVSYTGPGDQARYARWDGREWRREPVAADVWFTALALDASAQPRIAYFHRGARALMVARRAGEGWRAQRIDGIARRRP